MPDGGVYGAPRLPRILVSRRRLWEHLETVPADHVVVTVPAGSGATIGLADWLVNGPHPNGAVRGWLDLSSDTDPDAAWHRLLDLLRAPELATPASGEPRDLLLESGIDPRVVATRQLLQLTAPIRLVVDRAPASATLVDDLLALARTVPDLQVVTVLRGTPDRWVQGNWSRPHDLGVLDARALTLDVNETRDLLRAWGAPVPTAYAGRVHHLTGGHARSIHALAQALVRAEIPLEPAELTEDLLAELVRLDRLDRYPDLATNEGAKAPLRDRLARIAMADTPTLSLARRLAGDETAAPALAAAEELGLGAWSMTAPQPRFQLVPAAAALLRQELRATDPPGARELLRRITTWSLEHGHLTEAVVGALELTDLALAAAIVRDHRGRLLLARPPALDAIADALHPDMCRAEPEVADLAVLLYSLSSRHRAKALVCLAAALDGAAESAVDASGDAETAVGLSLLVTHQLAQGDAASAAATAERLAALLAPSTDVPAVPESSRVEHLRRIGLVRRAVGRDEAALAALEEAAAADVASAHPRQARVLSDLAAIRAADGDLAAAARVGGSMTPGNWPAGWLQDAPALTHHVYEAWAALEHHDPASAAHHLEIVEAVADATEFWTHGALPLAIADFLAAEPTGAAQTIEARRRSISPELMPVPWLESLVEALTLLDLGAGDVHRARERHLGAPPSARTALAASRVALFADALDEAAEQLDVAATRGLARPRDRADHGAIAAALALRTGRLATADDTLAALGPLLEELQLSLPVTLLPITDQRALRPRLTLSTMTRPHPQRAVPSLEPRLLTPREQIVLVDLAAGLKLTQIARRNVVSINTVKTQVRSIYRKLGVRSRDEAVAAAATRGLLPDAD